MVARICNETLCKKRQARSDKVSIGCYIVFCDLEEGSKGRGKLPPIGILRVSRCKMAHLLVLLLLHALVMRCVVVGTSLPSGYAHRTRP